MLGKKINLPFRLRVRKLAENSSLRKLKRDILYHWHLLNRVKGSTRQIAMGCAIGAAISMTPLLGMHLILGGLFVIFTRSSMVAMTVCSLLFGNPWTFPFIFWVNYHVGNLFINVSHLDHEQGNILQTTFAILRDSFRLMLGTISGLEFFSSLQNFMTSILPFLLGSIPLAIFVFLFVFYATEEAIVVYHDNKLKKRRKKKRKMLAEAENASGR